MAESLLYDIAKNVLGKITSLASEKFLTAWDFKKDIDKLGNTLKSIKAVLLDAEEQRVHNHELRVWLEKLKDVCYDAEDVLDEFEIEALRRQVVNRESIRRKVYSFFSCSNPLAFRLTMGHKIKEIKERLNEISADKEKFNLKEKIDNKRVIIRERETHSYVIASHIIGREKAKQDIINLITGQSEIGENVSVIPIVGVGGVGKTALAKLVFNDERVENDFELKMWVCVMEGFDLKQLIVKIILSATDRNFKELDLDQLQRKLQDELRGRKYLLVLDDVWSDVREKWIDLKTLLMRGAYGSKIIVTTRSHRVASVMGTVSPYILGVLPHDDCLSLFFKCAFREGQEHHHTNLMEIGEEIVKKCGGIPLAVRALGSLVYSSTNEHDWKRVRDNEIWRLGEKESDILPALRLSYDELPSHLKHCFVYCSIFPKDYVFDTIRLLQFWMAHGIIVQSPDGNEELETIGMRYLRELWSRSFFQDFVQDYDFFTFKLHDIMHDLAVQMAEGEFLIVDSNRKLNLVSEKVRHLSFVGSNHMYEKDIPNLISKSGKVRTISFPIDGEVPSKPFVESCISRFHSLRVLNLSDSNIEVLTKEIGNLKHLRHFTLERGSKIRKIPNSICKLQSLQTLDLSLCVELQELPRDVGHLIGLRAFAFTTKQKSLRENGIGCLNSLRILGILNCQNLEYLFKDIGQLKALRTLAIADCPSLISLPHSMKYLSSLVNLVFVNGEKLDLDLRMKSEWENKHFPPELNVTTIRPHLKVLRIGVVLQLVELPQWLLEAFANTLQRLSITYCPNFTTLPDPLRYLRSLLILSIEYCPKLPSLPEDILRLTALKKLKITGCPAVSERCKPGIGEDWPNIAHIPVIEIDGETIKSSDR